MKLFVIPAEKLGGRGGREGDAAHKGGRELRTEHLGISKRGEWGEVWYQRQPPGGATQKIKCLNSN